MSPSVSVIVRCFNEEQHIGRLLTGIAQQTVRDVEIVVVDSGSIDGTLRIVSQYPAKVLHIQPEEFSFGRSLNLGCQAASGEFTVIVSAHVYPIHNTWLESLLLPFSDPRKALVYGKQRGSKTTKYSEHQILAHWFPGESNLDQTHPFCNNANTAIRRSVWEQLSYDETLTGLEDLDWAKRALQLGYRIAYAAEAEVIHVHNERLRQTYNRYRREAIALRRIFPHERFNLTDFLGLLLGNVVSDYYYAWRDRLLWSNLDAIPLFRLMQFWGTYRGFTMCGPVDLPLRQTFYYPRGLKRFSGRDTVLDNGRVMDFSRHVM